MSKKKTPTPAFKTNLHNIFATDIRQEEEGAWVMVNEYEGLKIKVRRIKSEFAVKAYEKRVRENTGEGALRKPDETDADTATRLFHEHLAEVILCDWKNLRDADTKEVVSYSQELARDLIEMKDFREFVVQAASERDTFREKADAEAEGN